MSAISKLVRLLLVCGIALGSGHPGWAVVVSTPGPTTERPEEDFGWDNVGILNNSTALYLGNRWVIGADHVGAGAVNFPEIGSFEADLSTKLQLQDPPGSILSKPPDLILFQLLEDPGLPPLDVTTVTPSAGTEVRVVGHGLRANPELTHWDVTQRGASWIWTETSEPSDYSGFKTIGPPTLQWGGNLVEDEESFKNEFDDNILTRLNATSTQTWTFLTEFDSDNANSDDAIVTSSGSSEAPFEAQAVLADSGGGLFVQEGLYWRLGGVILSVEGHRDQPDETRTAIFGNLTYYADLATYSDQIRDRVLFGDFDGDRSLTVDDVDALIAAVRQTHTDRRFDLDGDKVVSTVDLDRWVTDVFGTYIGDGNLDGVFDSTDLTMVLVAGGYEDGITGNASWSSGDWNGDGDFDSSDLVVALQDGGYEAGPRAVPTSVSTAAQVPEPSGALLILVGAAGGFHSMRRRMRRPQGIGSRHRSMRFSPNVRPRSDVAELPPRNHQAA